jgi:hypothetical protein
MSDGSTTSAAQHNLLSLSEIQANAANPVMQAKVHSSGNEQPSADALARDIKRDVEQALGNPDDAQALANLQKDLSNFSIKDRVPSPYGPGTIADPKEESKKFAYAQEVQKDLDKLLNVPEGTLPSIRISGPMNGEPASIWAMKDLPGEHKETHVISNHFTRHEWTGTVPNQRQLLVESNGYNEMDDRTRSSADGSVKPIKNQAGWNRVLD